jgi:hypothetical protein
MRSGYAASVFTDRSFPNGAVLLPRIPRWLSKFVCMEDMTISIALVVTVVAFVQPAPVLRGFTDVLPTEMRMRCDLFARIPDLFLTSNR